MSYFIDFLPEVEQDVAETYVWYEEQLSGLGEDFLLSVDAAINGILRKPLLNSIVYKNVRKVKVKRFPFGVFYLLNGNIITIISVIHLSRHPRNWRRRARK
jgi:toxin ParE1/3/4